MNATLFQRCYSFFFLLMLGSIPLVVYPATHDEYGVIKSVVFGWCVWGVFMSSLCSMIAQKRTHVVFPYSYLFLTIFLLYSLSAFWYAKNRYEVLEHSSLWLSNGVLLFSMIGMKHTRYFRRIAVWVVLGTACAAIGYTVWINKGYSLLQARINVRGTFGHPAFFAEYLALTIPFAVWLFLTEEKKSLKSLAGGVVLLILAFLFLTRTRASLLAVAITLFIFAIIHRRRILHYCMQRRIIVGLMFVGSLMVVILPWGGRHAIVKRVSTVLNPQQARYEYMANQTITMRLVLWENTLKLIQKYPLHGVGFGNYWIHYPEIRSKKDWDLFPRGIRFARVHNEVLQIFAEGGIVGGGLFLLWVFWSVKEWRIRVKSLDHNDTVLSDKLFMWMCGAVLCIAAINALFSSNLRITPSSMMIFCAVGFVATFSFSGRTFRVPLWGFIIPGLMITSIVFFSVPQLRASIEAKSAFIEEKKGQDKLAIEKLSSSLRHIPYKGDRWFLLGNLYQRAHDIPRAIAAYEQGLKYDPLNPYFYNNLGTVLYMQKKVSDAVQLFRNCVEIDPYYIGGQYNLRRASRSLGNEEASQTIPHELFASNPLFYAELLMKEHKWEEVISSFDAVIGKQNETAKMHMLMGHAYQKLHNYEAALEHFDRAIALSPYEWELYYMRGLCALDDRHDFSTVRDYFSRALSLIPQERKKRKEMMLEYEEMGFLSHAGQETEQIYELTKKEFEILATIIRNDVRENRVGTIQASFEQLVAMRYYDAATFRAIIKELFEHGEYDNVVFCISILKKTYMAQEPWFIMEDMSREIRMYHEMAEGKEQCGEFLNALTYYEQIIRLNPQDVKAVSSRNRLRLKKLLPNSPDMAK